MPTTVTVNSNYNGIGAGVYIHQSFKESDTLEKGLVVEMPFISNGKASLKLLEGANGQKDYACDFVPTGSVTLSEKFLEPKKLMIELQICKEDFRATWNGDDMGPSAWNNGIPAEVKDALLSNMMDQLKENTDSYIWIGSATQSGQFDGFIPKLEADGDVIDITATASITAANVVGELNQVYFAIPENIFGKKDLVIIVSNDVYRAYLASQTAAGNNFVFQNQNPDISYFNGVKLVMVGGLPSKTIIAYRTSNFVFGSALKADYNRIDILDMTPLDLSDNIKVKMVFSADTEYYYGAEVVLYN
jgi:hypothetical protein